MRSMILLMALLPSLPAVEYSYTDARAMMALEATTRQMGVELYLDPRLVDSLVELRLTAKGKADSDEELLAAVCDAIGKAATKNESLALNEGEQILVTHQIIKQGGKSYLLATRTVKKKGP